MGLVSLVRLSLRYALFTFVRANPHIIYEEDESERVAIRARNVPQVVSRYKEKFASVRPPGDPGEQYRHGPLSAFQARCRSRPVTDLQHFTRCLKDEIVERLCNVKLRPGGNFNGESCVLRSSPEIGLHTRVLCNRLTATSKPLGLSVNGCTVCERAQGL